jgi:hypothetical protein
MAWPQTRRWLANINVEACKRKSSAIMLIVSIQNSAIDEGIRCHLNENKSIVSDLHLKISTVATELA